MSNAGRIIRTVLILGAVCLVGAIGAFSAFSSQTDNPGDVVAAGTVVLADNDAGASLYAISNAKPGSSQTSCIRVALQRLAGRRRASLHAERDRSARPLRQPQNRDGSAGLAKLPELHGVHPRCGWSDLDGALLSFPASYASGVVDYPGSCSKWAKEDSVVYRVTASVWPADRLGPGRYHREPHDPVGGAKPVILMKADLGKLVAAAAGWASACWP